MSDTVGGRHPAAVEVGTSSHYFLGFIYPRWLFGISSTTSTIRRWCCWSGRLQINARKAWNEPNKKTAPNSCYSQINRPLIMNTLEISPNVMIICTFYLGGLPYGPFRNHYFGQPHIYLYLGGGFKDFLFLPRSLGKWSNLTSAYFSGGLVQPPTSECWFFGLGPLLWLPGTFRPMRADILSNPHFR